MTTTLPPPVDDFADPHDPGLFPTLSGEQLAVVAERGQRRRFTDGQLLFEHGQRDAPFFLLESGAVDFLDRRHDGDRYFARALPGTFIGDVAILTGEATVAAAVAAGEVSVIELDQSGLRRVVADHAAIGDLVLQTMTARRAWLEGHGYGLVRLLGTRRSTEAFALRDLLERNRVPFTWLDVELDPPSRVLLETLGVDAADTPVLIRTGAVLRGPSVEAVANDLGLRARLHHEPYDVAVVGAGPAGLAAAVYAASEGLDTVVLEAFAPGGQAGTSARIENYLGFPTGVSGRELADRATLQARKFDATLSSCHRVVSVTEPTPGRFELRLADGQIARSRSVVIATGATYRRLPAEGASRFQGAGLYAAATHVEARQVAGEDVVVVGAGNSAGQAIVHLADHAATVIVVTRRGGLAETMSAYLVDRIAALANVRVVPHAEVVAFAGSETLEGVTVRDRRTGATTEVSTAAVFAMVGAVPHTDVVRGCVGVDQHGFVVTGTAAAAHRYRSGNANEGAPPLLPLETTRPGVLAIGDVRAGSPKRVAAAVGDGALAARVLHDVLARRRG